METKTLNKKVNDLIKLVVSDKNSSEMSNTSKRLTKELNEDLEYKKLVKAVEDYKLKYYNNDKEYKVLASANLRATFRAASKCIKGCNIPFEYTDKELLVNILLSRYLIDTDTRLASLVCKINERFEKKETRKKQEKKFTAWNEEEIKQINSLVELGILSEEEAKNKIEKGKEIK